MGDMNATWTMRLAGAAAIGLCAVILLNGCATAPSRLVTGYTPARGEKAAKTAVSMIGRPYRYQGDSPAGFDCSGLVRYSYLSAGMDVPHGTKDLKKTTTAVSPRTMRKGDLLFFSERGKNYSHVGIYLENNLFVHAPSSGGKVRKDSLTDPYWKKSFLGARRFD
jgi:cell wall-associated NlpC family hydrolase